MIKENLIKIFKELPIGVKLVAATKQRSVDEIRQAFEGGLKIVGENYIQEAKDKFSILGTKLRWHFIGHLQKNKIKSAVKIFNMVETLDSVELAAVLDKECKTINKVMPVLIEVNSAREAQKSGVLPQDAEALLKGILQFSNLKPMGLMTMGPWLDDAQKLRPFFRETKNLFDKIKNNYSSELEWIYLSMGMSSSYKVAIEEGANIVRIGTAIFGERPKK